MHVIPIILFVVLVAVGLLYAAFLYVHGTREIRPEAGIACIFAAVAWIYGLIFCVSSYYELLALAKEGL